MTVSVWLFSQIGSLYSLFPCMCTRAGQYISQFEYISAEDLKWKIKIFFS